MATTSTTHICLVLDRSGSMQAVHADALGGVNTYIQGAKKDRALYEAKFSLITFNSESVDTIRKNAVMETVKPIGSEEYECDGWTPLYDAIGRGIGILDEATAEQQCQQESGHAHSNPPICPLRAQLTVPSSFLQTATSPPN